MKLARLALFVALASKLVAESANPVEVMIVGVAHFANPGRDLHDIRVDDVLAPGRQAEIQKVTDALARFRPTMVFVESSAAHATQQYARYCAGTLPPSRNEVVQLGFRLARQAGLSTVVGADVGGDFPYEAVKRYAESHGQQSPLQQMDVDMEDQVQRANQVLAKGSISDLLLFLNSPSEIAEAGQTYRLVLEIGQGADQPGADLLTAWYRRNFYISANIVQQVRPGDRAVVFFGAGHAFLLRQLVNEMPGWRLVEVSDYLRSR